MSKPKPSYVIGVDLGKMSDYTAIAVCQRTAIVTNVTRERFEGSERALIPEAKLLSGLELTGLKRPEKLTPYPVIARMVRDIRDMLYRDKNAGEVQIVVDATGVGAAVVDGMKELGIVLTPVVITGGHKAKPNEWGQWLVPKKDLVSRLRYVYDEQRIKMVPAEKLPIIAILLQELDAYKMRITKSGNQTYGNEHRESEHDDLVLAVALAVWQTERTHNAATWERKQVDSHVWLAQLEMAADVKRLERELRRPKRRFGF